VSDYIYIYIYIYVWAWSTRRGLELKFYKLPRPWSLWGSSRTRENTHCKTGNRIRDLMGSYDHQVTRLVRERKVTWSIIHQVLRSVSIKPYTRIPHLLHALNYDGLSTRIQIFEWFLNVQAGNIEFTTKILPMDEVTSNKNGRLREDNFVYLSNITQFVWQRKSLIFMSKSASQIVQQVGLDVVTSTKLKLQTFCWNCYKAQCCRRLTGVCGPGWSFNAFGRNVHAFLNEKFSIWISRAGSVDWLPRSSDPSSSECSMWRAYKIKGKVRPITGHQGPRGGVEV
jgi:hypothetical protein